MKVSEERLYLVFAYMGALDLAAVKVMMDTPTCSIGFLKVEPQADLVEREGQFEAFWFAKATYAEMVANFLEAEGVTADVPSDRTPAQLRDMVANACGQIGAKWQNAAEVCGSASVEVDEIERHVSALKQAGGLASFNAYYKRYRSLCMATALPAIPYSNYLFELKVKIVEKVARNTVAGIEKFSGITSIKLSLPDIKRRDHFSPGEDPPRWLTATSHPFPGWSPAAPFRHRK